MIFVCINSSTYCVSIRHSDVGFIHALLVHMLYVLKFFELYVLKFFEGAVHCMRLFELFSFVPLHDYEVG